MAQRKFTVVYQGGESYHTEHFAFLKGATYEMTEAEAKPFMNRTGHGFYVTEVKPPEPPAPPPATIQVRVDTKQLAEAEVAPAPEATPETPPEETPATEVAAPAKSKPGPKPAAKKPAKKAE